MSTGLFSFNLAVPKGREPAGGEGLAVGEDRK